MNVPGYGGRTGPRWSPEQGQRIGLDDRTVVFPERDNRGKVYLYFSHEDTTVGIKAVSGIGTFGVPDTLPDGTGAMSVLKDLRFYQRLWSKRERDGQPVRVGEAPGPVALRAKGEREDAEHRFLRSALSQRGMEVDELRSINGEALSPSFAPQMFGGEAVTGSATSAGIDIPDAVSQNNALGNPSAKFKWLEVRKSIWRIDLEQERSRWNEGKAPDDQTHDMRQEKIFNTDIFRIEREETPNEIRARLVVDPKEWDYNSYHSAVLRDPENHRWVTAMDIAIGQAKCLDDPVMRAVLVAIADWRLDKEQFNTVCGLSGWSRLSPQARELVMATYFYYDKGIFPSADLVSLTPPSLVTGASKKGADQ
jgi:hypothetical protein